MKNSWWKLLISCVNIYDKTTVWKLIGCSYIRKFNFLKLLSLHSSLPSLYIFFFFWMRLVRWCLGLVRFPLHVFLLTSLLLQVWKDSWKKVFWEKTGSWRSGKLTFSLYLKARKDLNENLSIFQFLLKSYLMRNSIFWNDWKPAFLLESFQMKNFQKLFLWITLCGFSSTLAAGESSNSYGCFRHDFPSPKSLVT